MSCYPEVGKLKGESDANRELVRDLLAERERARKEMESIKGHLNAEIQHLKQKHARETEKFRVTLEEVHLDRTMLQSQSWKLRESLDRYAPMLDASILEAEALRRELSNMKDSNRVTAELQQHLINQDKELHSAREESSALKKELNTTRSAHEREMEMLKMDWQNHVQQIEHLTVDCERVREDRDSIKRNLDAEIEWLKFTLARQTEQLRATYTLQPDGTLREVAPPCHDLSKSEGSAAELQQRLAEYSQIQSEVERLKGELNAARGAHKQEVETLKLDLQEHAQRAESLTVDRERAQDMVYVNRNLNVEIKQLETTPEVDLDLIRAGSELGRVKSLCDICVHKQDESLREMEALRHELSLTKESATGLQQRLNIQSKELHSAREESSVLKKELDAACETHEREVNTLKLDLKEHIQLAEHMAADAEHVRKEMDSVKGGLNAEIEWLRQRRARETEQLETTLKKVNHDLVQADSELRKLRSSHKAHTPRANELLHETETLRQELSLTKDSAAELRQLLDTQTKELDSVREKSSALETLLDNRTSELRGAQSFLTTADSFSGAEVAGTVQSLNAELLQASALMAESMAELFFHEIMVPVSKTDEQLVASKRILDAIGSVIIHFLGTKKHKEDPIMIQIAFQAYLTQSLNRIVHAWTFSGDENHNRFIDAIYQNMHEKEAQAIAGRWRALTRTHVPLISRTDSQIAFEIADKIIAGLSDILLATGCTVPKSDIVSALSSKFTEKLISLVSSAMTVNKIIGKGVTSGDLEVMVVPPAIAFDGTTMEDSYDDGGSVKARGSNVPRVLCTTDLGLKKKTRVGTAGEEQWETKLLLKPKVVLESVIDILDERATCA